MGKTFFLGLIAILFIVTPIHSASYPFNISKSFDIDEKPLVGALIARDGDGYRLTKVAYDSDMIGVVVDAADLMFEYGTILEVASDSAHILESGEADVLVNATNGQIKKGDYIAASSVPGEGMKANLDGMVIGIALEDYQQAAGKKNDLVQATVSLRLISLGEATTGEALFSKYSIFDPLVKAVLNFFRIGPEKLARTPPFLRYLFAILLIIIALIFGFFLFARTAIRGIESLGRNPLARWTIIAGILINFTFAILLIGVAVILAYIILSI